MAFADRHLAELDEARQWAQERPSRNNFVPPPTASPTPSAPPAVTKPKPPRQKKPPAPPSRPKVHPIDGTRAAAVVAFALNQVGKPYRFATAGPSTFDCSGLAKAAYAVVGISIPHQTGSIVRRGQQVSRSELAPGDLVFPSSGHVGIYIGKGQMVHAPKPGDHVKVAGLYAFWTARRLL